MKSLFPDDCQEVVVEKRKDGVKKHRADVKYKKWVVELQSSSISDVTIQEREEFYGENMIWIIDGSKFSDRITIRDLHTNDQEPGRSCCFFWNRPRTSWDVSDRQILLDLPQGIFVFYGMGIQDQGEWLHECSMNDFGDLGEVLHPDNFEDPKRQLLLRSDQLFREWYTIMVSFVNGGFFSSFEKDFIWSHVRECGYTPECSTPFVYRLANHPYSDRQLAVINRMFRRIFS